ncbi:general secretion pathway protein GspB [Massilia sp. DWR3-1-1]|uniref:general secretion pathway protein GspB n=1 Tax=Massilia sp. DWR3-1-1 TaxID=2804559 RepID=UPI003CF2361F
MSYILEALKKAQAERQLGHAPTLDAVPVGTPAPRAARARGVAWIGAGAGVAAALVVGAVVWALRAPAPAPTTTAPALAPAPAALSVAPASAPPLAVAPASTPALPKAAPPAPPRAAPVAAAAPVNAAAPANGPAPAAASVDDEHLPALRDLPDNVRAAIPQVRFGGYMYSSNPADRLVLIDKVLRHEGEEVAPGLVLEKLLPRAALMNYRGTRYKVAY